MKERIYTIPLTEAYEEKTECPFCNIEKKLEDEAVQYSLGAAMMEPDFRIVSNDKGYCRRHFEMMQKESKALSLALVLDTHLNKVISDLKELKILATKKKPFSKKENVFLDYLKRVNSSCVICDKIEEKLDKFAENFWFLYKTEADFKEKVLKSKGFCLPHFMLLISALEKVSGSEKIKDEFIEMELKNLECINADVNAFTKKFDYRFVNEPWETAKDAPEVAIHKLSKF